MPPKAKRYTWPANGEFAPNPTGKNWSACAALKMLVMVVIDPVVAETIAPSADCELKYCRALIGTGRVHACARAHLSKSRKSRNGKLRIFFIDSPRTISIDCTEWNLKNADALLESCRTDE